MSRKKRRPSPPAAAASRAPSSSSQKARSNWLFAAAAIVLLLGAGTWWAYKSATSESKSAANTAGATFVDEAGCVGCHAEQHKAWQGSHHDRAMEEPNASTVL